VSQKSEISHLCHSVKNFPQVDNKLPMVYCTAETTHDQTQTISIIRCRKNSVKCKYIDFWPISDFFFI